MSEKLFFILLEKKNLTLSFLGKLEQFHLPKQQFSEMLQKKKLMVCILYIYLTKFSNFINWIGYCNTEFLIYKSVLAKSLSKSKWSVLIIICGTCGHSCLRSFLACKLNNLSLRSKVNYHWHTDHTKMD